MTKLGLYRVKTIILVLSSNDDSYTMFLYSFINKKYAYITKNNLNLPFSKFHIISFSASLEFTLQICVQFVYVNA